MRKEKRTPAKIITTISVDIEQDKWLREHRDFNLSGFLRESLQKKIEEGRGNNDATK